MGIKSVTLLVFIINVTYFWRMECLNCKREVEQTRGKRRKLYCSENCRVEYCRKKKAADKPKRGRGRPKKAIVIEPVEIQAKIEEVKERIKDDPRSKMKCPTDISESFMGHKIPTGLKGIDLSIWKAEIKEKNGKN